MNRSLLTPGLWTGLLTCALVGCAVPPPARPPLNGSDLAPHAMAPTPMERPFDGSLFVPGGFADLASDAVAMQTGDPVIIRFGMKNGYPGVPQSRITRIMAQVVSEEGSGNLLVSGQRTIRDASGTRRLVLVGRIARSSIEAGNEIPVSLVSMLRFRSDSAAGRRKTPRFAAPAPKPPGLSSGPAKKSSPGAVKSRGKTP